MLFALASCSDNDEVFTAKVEYPAETVGDVLTVDAWYNEFPLAIEADGAWQIETANRFLTVEPQSGSGNATVTVSVQANQSEERKTGSLSILFPGHEEMNCKLVIEQKFAGDYDENDADLIDTSNKIYAVGYSYDATDEWASDHSLKVEVFDTRRLIGEGKLVVGPTQASLKADIITGSSISDITKSLALSANIEGGFGKFKAEANSAFSIDLARNSNYEYALTYVNLDVRRASFDIDFRTLCDFYMTDDAWYAINGVPRLNERDGKSRVSYPSDDAGLKKLVQYYGTHVVLNSRLGGRVRHSMTVDISKVTSAYDLKAFAEASYSGVLVNIGGSVDEKLKQSYESNKSNVNIKVNVVGGDESLSKMLTSNDGFTKENLDAWVQSVSEQNMALVGFDSNSLIPLYELVDETLTEAEDGVDGKKRKDELKKYIESDMASDPDFSSYDCGSVTEFDVCTFNGSDYNSSLIKTVELGGQLVGYICNEYIPLIDRTERVTVIYPVVSNTPRYNMGFFIGDSTHKPARVCWEGSTCTISEYPELDFGSAKKLYLRGASVSAEQPDGTKTHPGTLEDYRMKDLDGNWYPLVKIFDHIWMRQDYKGVTLRNGKQLESYQLRDTYYYRSRNGFSFTDEYFPPVGWRITTSEDFLAIVNKLKANGIELPGKEFFGNGALGFASEGRGYYSDYNNGFMGTRWQDEGDAVYWSSEAAEHSQDGFADYGNKYIHITKEGAVSVENEVTFVFSTSSWMNRNYQFYIPVRLVKE